MDDDYYDMLDEMRDQDERDGEVGSEPCPECGADMELQRKRSVWYCHECDAETDYEPPEPPDPMDDDYPIDGVGFAEPGGRSALRAATRSNPRNMPCPTCGAENVLTPADLARGYQCNRCADAAEGCGP